LLQQRNRQAVWRSRTFWSVFAVTLLIALLFNGLYIYRSWSRLLAERTHQAHVTAHTMVQSLPNDLEDLPKIKTELERVAFGAVHYAQFLRNGRVLAELRSPDVIDLSLPLLEATERTSLPAERLIVDGSLLLLDIAKPLPNSNGYYIRLGFSVTSVVWMTLQEALFMMGVSLLAVVALSLLLSAGLTLRTPDPGRGEPPPHHAAPTPRLAPPAAGESAASASVIQLNGFQIDDTSKKVIFAPDGRSLILPPKEYCLLWLLASQPERVFSEEEIRQALWPDDPTMTRKDATQYVYLVRKRFREHGISPIIENVRGHGYKIST
jgi:DNA-binding winged helix-turn-helix (wHTH) protein